MILFHPSSLGKLMAGEGKPIAKSVTCKKELIKIFLHLHYGRKRVDLKNNFLSKGNIVEKESISIYNIINGTNYVKNEETLTNDYFIGTPDVKADIVLEAKSNWDLDTHWDAITDGIEPAHEWQTHGYMDLTGIKKARLFYALCNTPYTIIQDEKKKLAWQMGCIEDETEGYIKICQQIEINHIFDMARFQYDYPYFDFHNNPNEWNRDIPITERFHVIDIPYDQSKIDRIKKRLDECRKWLEMTMKRFTIPERIDTE